MGYNECFEPYTSFLYTRSTLAGQFEVVNHKLLRDLIDLGLWNKEMKNKMLLDDGSIQNIPEIKILRQFIKILGIFLIKH